MEKGVSKALTRGLEVLRLLSESRVPMTSTEIAKRVGLHQSWVSRVLKTLSAAGYVRKPDYHCFTIDYGALTLGGNALLSVPFMTRPKKAMQELAERCEGMNVALATLWRSQLIYFMRTQKGHEPIPLAVGFPLHLSSVALRLLVDLPKDEALEILKDSARRYGWERPTPSVPRTSREVLSFARSVLQHDCLVLDGYNRATNLGASIPIEVPGEPRAALAISGPRNVFKTETVLLLLQEGRRAVETAMCQMEKVNKKT